MKDGSFRPVIDFRRVNEVTEDGKYPLPVLKDLLMSLGQGNTIFSSLQEEEVVDICRYGQ